MNPFDAVLNKSQQIGLPKSYKSDLDHDRKRLEEERPERFGWLARETGTWLVTPNNCHDFQTLGYCIHNQPDHRAFWWDGETFKEVKLQRVWDRMYELSHQKVREFARLDGTCHRLFDSISHAAKVQAEYEATPEAKAKGEVHAFYF